MEPRGILRNRSDAKPHDHNEGDLDRQEVIRNTRLNAQLSADSTKGDKIRAKIAEAKAKDPESTEPHALAEHLKWDEINLYKTEQEKAATMKIDEPKTPYEGGFNPEGEYYREDGDDAAAGEIPEFSLGEGQFDSEQQVEESLNGGEVLPAEEEEEEEEPEEKPLLAEEKHKKFEEMRKAHYHHAATPLKHKIEVSDDDEA